MRPPDGMLRLSLVRHGVTEWNRQGRFQGHADVPLGEEGRFQAQALAPKLAGQPFSHAYTSDLLRASETARLALPGLGATPEPRLRELNFGDFDGRTYAENLAHPGFEGWMSDPLGRACPGGESHGDLRDRALGWLAELPDEGEVIAFAHGGTIQAIVHGALGLPTVQGGRWPFPWRIKVTHGSLTTLERWPTTDGGRAWVLERLNDRAHLE